jgi:hypothetical protein
VDWHLTCFGDPQVYQVELTEAAKEVDSVVNCRVIGGKYIIAGVSGGVRVHPELFVQRKTIGVVHDAALAGQRSGAGAKNQRQQLPDDRWWWD